MVPGGKLEPLIITSDIFGVTRKKTTDLIGLQVLPPELVEICFCFPQILLNSALLDFDRI